MPFIYQKLCVTRETFFLFRLYSCLSSLGFSVQNKHHGAKRNDRPELEMLRRPYVQLSFLAFVSDCPVWEIAYWGYFQGVFFFVQSSMLQITSQNKQEIVRWEGSECSRRADVMFRSDAFDITFWCNFTCIHVFENGGPLRMFYKVDSFHVIG